jgi:LTXXQ motif family protein
MKRSLSILTMTAVIGSGLALAGAATAQQPANPAPARPTTPMPQYTAADAGAVLNARIAALKTVIALSPEQEKLWPPVEAAIRDIAKSSFERLKQRLAAPPTTDFLVALGKIADAEEARAKDLKTFIAAAKPLVASLSPEQKRRVPAFFGMTGIPGGQPSGQLWLFEEEEG